MIDDKQPKKMVTFVMRVLSEIQTNLNTWDHARVKAKLGSAYHILENAVQEAEKETRDEWQAKARRWEN